MKNKMHFSATIDSWLLSVYRGWFMRFIHSQKIVIKPLSTLQKSFRFCIAWYTINISLRYVSWFLHCFGIKRKHQFPVKINAFFYLDQFFFSGTGEWNCNYWHLMNEIRPFHFVQSFEKQQGGEHFEKCLLFSGSSHLYKVGSFPGFSWSSSVKIWDIFLHILAHMSNDNHKSSSSPL